MTNVTGQRLWPMLLLLLAVVLTPTVFVLWVTAQATLNERLAIGQKLTDSYTRRLDDMPAQVEAYWKNVVNALKAPVADAHAARARFGELVGAGVCDGVVFYGIGGAVLYPSSLPTQDTEGARALEWFGEARRLEFESGDYKAAAAAYATAAPTNEECKSHVEALRRALALQAQARCLAKAGAASQAIAVLRGPLASVMHGTVADEWGRLLALDGELRSIELMPQSGDEFSGAVQALAAKITKYSPAIAMPSAQRCFIMRRLLEIVPTALPRNLLDAEDLTAAYLESDPAPERAGVLAPTAAPGVWRLASEDGASVALFREQTLLAASIRWSSMRFSGGEATAQLVPASLPVAPPSLRIPGRVGERMPGWAWEIRFRYPDPFGAAADRRVLVYAWAAGLTLVCVAAFAALLGYFVTRQLRLTRLKNELIDIVSHELKTPLAGMRVLVDTLLNGRCPGREQELEYLRLIERENTRLSHLIDNLLTFSRMEHNRRAFEIEALDPAEVVNAAADALRDRCNAPNCRLDVDIQANLPTIRGDRDALTTVLINLLDNAIKYTGDDKRLRLKASAEGAEVRLEVQDNGIGLSRRAARRVFDRFYQVDRTLSRRAGGCGLGLSIVKFIVTAHGGAVEVRSEPGKGSSFVVTLPADGRARRVAEEIATK